MCRELSKTLKWGQTADVSPIQLVRRTKSLRQAQPAQLSPLSEGHWKYTRAILFLFFLLPWVRAVLFFRFLFLKADKVSVKVFFSVMSCFFSFSYYSILSEFQGNQSLFPVNAVFVLASLFH